MFIVEQDIGLEHLETIIQLKKSNLLMYTKHSEEEKPFIDYYPYKVKSIQSINRNNFIIHEDGTNNIRLLTVEYSGTDKYEEKLVFRENSEDIVKVLCCKNNLYILSSNGNESSLKCFILEPNLELTPTGIIENLETTNPAFIDEFVQNTCINTNVLISSESKFAKIYHNEDKTITTSLQNYYNFLPDARE